MAQRVVVTLSDDIDGGEAAETVVFGIDGKSYEIDLSTSNAEKLRQTLEPYLSAGRKKSASGAVYKRSAVDPNPATVRAWASSHGMEVPARGRIPKRIYESFNAAH
ncbi:Lsr2 family protein [Streptomyces polyrhachis]|uniref:Lsr2 family protein n=1 Tax=Streptomyces polyrhachis TaxID=1282885 RepID=A0ABW2GIL8_9ACTN